MKCRYCDQSIDADPVKTVAYWGATPDWCHRQCKESGVKREAYECQLIDADCNDCRHYKRGRLAPERVSVIKTRDGRFEEVRFQPNLFIGGHCLKLDKPTDACPNKWTGHECFEHRRAQ